MKRRKRKADRKEEQIRLRLTGEQKKKLTDAAKRVDLDVSTWIRTVALREAERVDN